MALTTQQKWAIGLLLAAGIGGLFWWLGDDDRELESEPEFDLNDPEVQNQMVEFVANFQEVTNAAFSQLGPISPLPQLRLISPLPQGYKATRPYGRVRAAFDPSRTVFHKGVDIGAPQGTPVYAVADGTVSTSKAYLCTEETTSCWNGYKSAGEGIWITHPQFGSKAYSGYLHLHQRYKQVGDEVKQGDLIGTVGNTGASTSPHLHFEVWLNNKAVDPAHHLPEHALDRARMAARLV